VALGPALIAGYEALWTPELKTLQQTAPTSSSTRT
jgi:hypothetical protein